MKTRINGRFVIGYAEGDHVVYKNGCVVYEGDSIIYVGQHYSGDADRTIDAGNCVVSPGFIDLDALGDIDHQLFDTNAADKNGLLWSTEYYDRGPTEAMTAEEEAFKSYFAYTQLIKNGVTTAMPITGVYSKKSAETYEEIAAAAEHAGRLGLRTYLGPSYIAGMRTIGPDGTVEMRYNEEEGLQGLERAVKFVKDFDGAYGGLITGVLVPERVEFQTEATLKKTKEYGRELGCLVRLHAAQSFAEYSYIMARNGMSTVAYLDKLGFLDDKTLIPHAIYVSGFSKIADKGNDDLETLVRRGVSVIHCPFVFAEGGMGLESFGRYLEAGLNISMGTDTFPPDFFVNIRAGAYMSRHYDDLNGRDGKNSRFSSFFRAATLGGAKALGREDLGRLCPGAKADIIIISLEDYAMGVVDDPITTLCLAACGRDVKTSIINGRIVMEDRVIPGLDEKEATARAQQYYNKMKSSYLGRSYRPFDSVGQLFLDEFKMI